MAIHRLQIQLSEVMTLKEMRNLQILQVVHPIGIALLLQTLRGGGGVCGGGRGGISLLARYQRC